ncbi:MAG: hypothetical protein J6W70_02315 [Lentisphaeria bacterium]|nr:hypothetical protein [Lentisphaeria bacterium]
MKHRFSLIAMMLCCALCQATAGQLEENLLDVVEAAQNAIQKKYPSPDSIARKIALEELEKIARSGQTDEQIVRAILEKYPEATAEQSIQADQNLNGIPDEWERKYNVSARFAAPESDEDGDGFSLIREYRAGTNPVDPLSHPKYITQIYFTAIELVRINGLELLSVSDMSGQFPNNPDKQDWEAAFSVVRNNRQRTEYARIKNYSGTTFTNNGVSYYVDDIVDDPKTHEPVVYIKRDGDYWRIPCRIKQPIYDPRPRVRLLNPLDAKVVVSGLGDTFKLGSKQTGEEEYRIVTADPDAKIVSVQSVGENPEEFKIPPVKEEPPATKSPAPRSQPQDKE